MFYFLLFNFVLSLPNDPLLDKQFDLNNKGIYGSRPGEDLNIFSTWELSDFEGSKAVTAIIGRGCYLEHADLSKQRTDLHYNFDDGTHNVGPEMNDEDPGYATGLLGIALGAENGICTAGVAYNSSFYCLKTTVDTKNKLLEAMEYKNNETQVKLIATPHSYEKIENSNYVRFDAPLTDIDMYRFFEHGEDLPDFIAAAGTGSTSGADTNFFTETRDPHIITVADTTPNGARSHWSPHGTSILVNAPAGGSPNSLGYNNYKPNPPTIGIESEESCNENEFTPIGVGSAHVAGLVALLRDEHDLLTPRDMQYVIALSAQKNDPKHKSWQTNAAGFNYSNVYGFGRVDSDRAYEYAEKFENLPEQHYDGIPFDDITLYPRGGFENVSEDAESDIVFIEYCKLQFQSEFIDNLYLEVISPSGTVANVITPSLVKNEKDETYEYIIRNFFGEKASGQWTIRASYLGYIKESVLDELSLFVYGMVEQPNLNLLDYKEGMDSQAIFGQQGNVALSYDDNFECGKTFDVTLTGSGYYDLFLYDSEHQTRYQIDSDVQAGVQYSYKFPCYLSTKTLQVYAEQRETGTGMYNSINIPNNHNDSYIISPNPYDVIRIQNDQSITIPFEVSFLSNYLINDAEARTLIVGLYDLENNETIVSKPIDRTSTSVTFEGIKQSYSQAIFYVLPLWKDSFNGCDTLIQPLSILNKDEEAPSEKFIISLSDKCPTPPGVKTDDTPEAEVIPGNPTLRLIYISVFLSICGIIMIVILIWNFTCRKSNIQNTGLDSMTLVTNDMQ